MSSPVNSSVAAVNDGVAPPNANPEVLLGVNDAGPRAVLAVAKDVTVAQDVPL